MCSDICFQSRICQNPNANDINTAPITVSSSVILQHLLQELIDFMLPALLQCSHLRIFEWCQLINSCLLVKLMLLLKLGFLPVTFDSEALQQQHLQVHCESKKRVNDFQNSFTEKFTDKLAAKLAPTIPSHLKYVAILPCETLILENEQQSERCLVIQDKSQGNVATCLRCGGLFNHFTTNLLLSMLVKHFF